MTLLNTVLNAQTAAATALFDAVSLHTAAAGGAGANEDGAVTRQAPTWSSPSAGVSTASVTFTAVTGEWVEVGFWNSGTFVGSEPFATTVTYDVAGNLIVAFNFRTEELDD
jgi:hypothetical protein